MSTFGSESIAYAGSPKKLVMCGCPCHQVWGSITPPTCYCNCNFQVYQTPIKIVVEDSSDLKKEISLLRETINKIKQKLKILEKKGTHV